MLFNEFARELGAKGYGSMSGTVRFLAQIVIPSAGPVRVWPAYEILPTAKLG